MQYSKNGLSLTERFEGCRLTAYQDSKGVWTIGWGHVKNVCPGMVITQEQADEFLLSDVAFAAATVNRVVTVTLTQGEFDALVDFTFNLGCGSLEGSTLLKDLNAMNFAAAAGQFHSWDHAGGTVIAGLLKRRIAEEAEFEEVAK